MPKIIPCINHKGSFYIIPIFRGIYPISFSSNLGMVYGRASTGNTVVSHTPIQVEKISLSTIMYQ